MGNCETGRSTEIRNHFEQRYDPALCHFRISAAPEPVVASEDHQAWCRSIEFIERLKSEDPRTWGIVYRLATPIDQRLDTIKRQLLEKRKQYSKGHRRRMAEMFKEMVEGEARNTLYRQIEEDNKPGRGGFKADGTWVPSDPGVDPNPQDILPDQETIDQYESERDRYLRPLTPEERRRLDHELG